MKRKKKGFTIVELVIVIAVIAILASVLIPTFSGIIVKVKNSSDIQLCRNMNTTLATELYAPSSASEVQALFTSRGYGEDFSSTYEGNTYYWYKDKNIICLVDSSNTIVFPEDDDGEIQTAYDSSKATCFFALNGDYTSQADSSDNNNQTDSGNSGNSQQSQDSNNNNQDNTDLSVEGNKPGNNDEYYFIITEDKTGATPINVKLNGAVALDYKKYDFSLYNNKEGEKKNVTDNFTITRDTEYFSINKKNSEYNDPGTHTIEYSNKRNNNGDETIFTITYEQVVYTLKVVYSYTQNWSDLKIYYSTSDDKTDSDLQELQISNNTNIDISYNTSKYLNIKFQTPQSGDYSCVISNTKISTTSSKDSNNKLSYYHFCFHNNTASDYKSGDSVYVTITYTENNTLFTCRIKVTRIQK